jgi:D-glycero-alpha-D-manno-heptose-7-phosphate kinase
MTGARARCGCRIDLAGGTFDIWPLGLLFPGAVTVNVALELPVTVEIRPRAAGYELIDPDAGSRRADSLDELAAEPATALFGYLGRALELPPCSLRVTSASPRGAGLGASSSLGVALVAAADRWLGRPDRPPEATARLVRDVEAQLMGWPTGIQDHYPALLGGALVLEYLPGGERVRELGVDLEALGRHLVLANSGQSHLSGRTNWGVVRGCLDGDPGVRGLFTGIADVASRLPPALEAGDWPRVGALVGEEWALRRQLAEGVSVPAVERLLEAARARGAWGGKPGGAGGGGCVAILVPESRRQEIEDAVRGAGGEILEARPTRRGVQVETLEL